MTTSELQKERDLYFKLAEDLAEAMDEILQERVKHVGKRRKGMLTLQAWRGVPPPRRYQTKGNDPDPVPMVFNRPPAVYTNIRRRERGCDCEGEVSVHQHKGGLDKCSRTF